MILSRRQWWLFLSLFIGFIILLTLLMAPTRNQFMSGSTFAVSPDGYAAWYEFMRHRDTPIERWKKPLTALGKSFSDKSIILLRIYGRSSQRFVSEAALEWVKKGNTLIILASQGTVSEAPFTTIHNTDFGEVKIETTRRISVDNQAILQDQFGAIIEYETIGKGKLINVTTPYFAANAYKDSPGNYEFLAHLIESFQSSQLLVDEYIHGYKDEENKEAQDNNNVFLYLLKTPLLIILIQGLIIIIILIVGHNKSLNKKQKISPKIGNNSQQYINALATVLQKAESHEFVIKTIGQAEQFQLKKQLGLKGEKHDIDSLVQAWNQQTKQSSILLESLLKLPNQKRPFTDAKLLQWIKQWQTIHQEINSNQSQYDHK
ncbi:MAG: DUF4350 domain-containing protein [Crocosphaera sp.]|nr:DUF4350 domain-containing protein [Crocosphaera sp.]